MTRILSQAKKEAFYKNGFDKKQDRKECVQLAGSQFNVFEYELKESQKSRPATLIHSVRFSQIQDKRDKLRLAAEIDFLNYD